MLNRNTQNIAMIGTVLNRNLQSLSDNDIFDQSHVVIIDQRYFQIRGAV